jgi:quinol monooxygenase YgiN
MVLQFTAETLADAERQLARMRARRPEVEDKPGCLQYEVFRSIDDPLRFVMLEHWTDEESLQRHYASMPHARPAPAAPGLTREREKYEHHSSVDPRA